ncbi:TPA: hypothetical protein ACH3X3_006312 [Trebouxia sp. C0006]
MHPPLSVGPWHASFMMPAAVTNALHEEQASIMRAERQAEEEVSKGIPEGDRLHKAIRKYAAERYAQKQMHSGGTSPKGDQPSAEAKVLKAEENASRLAASFMMKAAVTKALHEEQASIVQADAKALVRAAEQRLQALESKIAEILRDASEYKETTEKRYSQAEPENQNLVAKHASWRAEYQSQHDLDVRSLLARHESAILEFQAEHSFAMQSVKAQHSFAFESSEAQHKSQIQAILAEDAAATVRAQSQHESEVKALRSQIAFQLELVAQHSTESEHSLSQQQAAHSNIVAQLQARYDAEASKVRKSRADAQAQHDSDIEDLKAEHEATLESVRAKAESAMSALRAQLSTLQESLAQHETQLQIAQAEHEANIHVLEKKHSDAIVEAQTELETLTAQNAAAADEALAQHEADVHALVAQREATDHAAKEVCESEAKLRKKSEANLAQAERTHAATLLSCMSELRVQHSDAIAKAQTEDTLRAQTAAAAVVDKASTQHQDDMHALIPQREATARADTDKCEAEAELKLVRKLLEESEASLAKSQKTHAAMLMRRLSELRVQHRSELADLQAAQSYGQDKRRSGSPQGKA